MIIQIESDGRGNLYGLDNYGKLYYLTAYKYWKPVASSPED